MDSDRLKQRLNELEREYDGRYSTCVVDLERDEWFERDAERVLPTASTFKLCALAELFRQSEAGRVDLDAPIAWTARHRRGGDGVLRAMKPGELSIRNVATLMIVLSDNVATSVIVELLGAPNVTRTMHEWGFNGTDLFESPGVAGTPQPVSTAQDLCQLITAIYRKELLGAESCDEIIRILRAQRCNDMLPRFIPVGEDWGQATTWIANKTGYGPCRVEVGIVNAANATFGLCMFFTPNGEMVNRFKCLADYPPVLAVAHGCKAVYDAQGAGETRG